MHAQSYSRCMSVFKYDWSLLLKKAQLRWEGEQADKYSTIRYLIKWKRVVCFANTGDVRSHKGGNDSQGRLPGFPEKQSCACSQEQLRVSLWSKKIRVLQAGKEQFMKDKRYFCIWMETVQCTWNRMWKGIWSDTDSTSYTWRSMEDERAGSVELPRQPSSRRRS